MSSDADFGLGLRPEHYEEIAASPGKVGWFEALWRAKLADKPRLCS